MKNFAKVSIQDSLWSPAVCLANSALVPPRHVGPAFLAHNVRSYAHNVRSYVIVN